MLPFSLALRPGEPVVDQVVYAVTRAVVSGQLRPGDRFPSVRTLSQELKVNPNTAQRIVALLVEGRLLAVEPGVGTVVTSHTTAGAADTAARRSELAALQSGSPNRWSSKPAARLGLATWSTSCARAGNGCDGNVR